MVHNTIKEIEFKICNNSTKIDDAEKIIRDNSNIYIDIYDTEYIKLTKNVYFDYTNYNKKKQANKLFMSGLYYKSFAEKLSSNPSKTSDVNKLKGYAGNYFEDALLLNKDPDYLLQLQELNLDSTSGINC